MSDQYPGSQSSSRAARTGASERRRRERVSDQWNSCWKYAGADHGRQLWSCLPGWKTLQLPAVELNPGLAAYHGIWSTAPVRSITKSVERKRSQFGKERFHSSWQLTGIKELVWLFGEWNRRATESQRAPLLTCKTKKAFEYTQAQYDLIPPLPHSAPPPPPNPPSPLVGQRVGQGEIGEGQNSEGSRGGKKRG